MLSTLREIFLCAIGVFSDNATIQNKSRTASILAAGTIVLAIVSIWLSIPVYEAIAATREASASYQGVLAAGVVAFVMFATGADLARNLVRALNPNNDKSVDPMLLIVLLALVWLGVGVFDIIAQYKGSGIRAVERSGSLKTTAQVEANPYGANILQLRSEIAELDFAQSWCKTHKSRHGAMYQNAMQTDELGIWSFLCPNQSFWYGGKQGKQNKVLKTGKLALIQDYQKKGNQALTLAATALDDENHAILQVRSAAETAFKFLTFALYLIQFLFSMYIAYYLDLYEDLHGNRNGHLWKKFKAEKQPGAGYQQGHQVGTQPIPSAELNRLKDRLDKLENPPQATDSLATQPHTQYPIPPNPVTAPKSPGETSMHTSTFQREIELNDAHPKFSRVVQPDQYRGIDEKKYKRMVKAAKRVLAEEGKYKRTAIAGIAGIGRNTVPRYLRLAFERGDLESE